LGGEIPFKATGRSWLFLIEMHSKAIPKLLKELGIKITDEMDNIVMRSLSKNPSERLTAKELEKLLQEVIKLTSR